MKFKNKHFTKPKILVAAICLLCLVLLITFQNCSQSQIDFSSTNPCIVNDEDGDGYCSEVFYPGVNSKKIDILFIDDNSGSMARYQAKMSDKFKNFLRTMGDVDYHIGIITTDIGDNGNLLRFSQGSDPILFLTPEVDSKDKLFSQTIRRSETGSGSEFPFLCAKKAIEQRNNHNYGFFRDNVELALVILTDENVGEHVDNFMATFKKAWGIEKELTVHGIVGGNDGGCNAENAHIIRSAINETGGIEGSICADNYGRILSELGSFMADSLTLSLTPVEGSIQVTVEKDGSNTILDRGNYSINSRKIIIHRGLQRGSKVTVRYQYTY